jgi:PAS domain S-box-containing protein
VKAKQKRTSQKQEPSGVRPSRDLIKEAMKKRIPGLAHAGKFLANGKGIIRNGKNGSNRSESELKTAIQRYVDLYDLAPVAYMSFDRVGVIEEANVAATQLLNRSRAALIGNPFAFYVAEEDSRLFLNHLLRCRSSKARFETELRLRKRGGEVFLARLLSTPSFSSMDGTAPHYQTAIVDLTERKTAEEAIRESEKRYRTLFDFVPTAIYTCDADGLILEFNQRAVELWGRRPKVNNPKEKFCGSFKIFYPDGRPMPHAKCPMARALHGEIVPENEREIEVEREDGERRMVAVSPTALKNEDGKIVGAINCLYDVTESKHATDTLARVADQQKALSQFVQQRHDAKSLGDIHAAGLDALFATLHCDRAAVLLFDASAVMRFVAARGLSRRYRRAAEGHSPWKHNVKNPRPIAIADIEKADFPVPLKRAIRAEAIGALAFMPLIAEGQLIGKVMVYYDKPHRFSRAELDLAFNIASQLALGIERKKAEEALRESEQLHRALVLQTAVGMARSNLKGKLVFVNKKLCDMLGYGESELLGKTILELTHPEEVAESRRQFRRIVREGEPYYLEKRYRRKDGSYLWVSVHASPMRDADGKTQSALAVILDIGDQKKAETVLQERARNLEGEILAISDREQRRLGQDLHDSLCQHLTAIAFMARSTATRLKNHRVIDIEDIEKIAELINDGVTEARTIARGLHPVEMDPAGLVAAMHALLHQQSKLPYRFDIDDDLKISDPTVSLHLYRIAREAVINANKHARARELVVRMRSSAKQIELSVTDDGVGMSNDRNKDTGMGFHIMEYRARSIGARLEITPVKPHGTRVACYVPRK